MMPVVFLGGGRITRALLAGLRQGGDHRTIRVYDRHPRKLQRLRRAFGIVAESDLDRAVAGASLLVVAVRPKSVHALLREIGKAPGAAVAISLAAGLPLKDLRAQLGPGVHWSRAMPSPVTRPGRGLIALAFDRGMTKRERTVVKNFFRPLGSVLVIPERRFDAFTAAYSVSHGYHALATLARAGQRLGLDGKTALTAAAHALADGILEWRDGKTPLASLLHEATTPGGIAATVMKTMDDAGYRQMIEGALRAGCKRARSQGQ
jgi:pyrroline-5-carboxylate reductase